ncbi:MAG TPA: hypothetical protein VMM36_14050 [Opitutaceae bacterium]|nr:hypothetical protein [Opitutaceae bacterium]
MPVTYRLDDLGWYEFERLIQSLLKVRIGVGIEAWGGTGDWGRDAYFEGELNYPSNTPSEGPFVFQCKFVEQANAAGADSEDLVLNAVRKERRRIVERLADETWDASPSHYALLTNAPLSPELRLKIEEVLSPTIGEGTIHIHDGEDLCGWLRAAPNLVKSCPQLLSLRDLEELLSDVVNAETITRSQATIALAQAESRVFVPTESYFEAREKLRLHHFVILEGPPEMGKTTIGRIIALTQMSDDWEALEVREPSEVLRMHRPSKPQVFVADDFFGRTEYDPTAVSRWQAELAHILPILDSSHWLILTSRMHLLEMARSRLDISGQHGKFPDLSEVLVNASALTTGEKARILYRHAKASLSTQSARDMVRQVARSVVQNRHFTPERIRRLVSEVVPRLANSAAIEPKTISDEVTLAITNPTKQMRISFRTLPDAHKWLLWSMLGSSRHGSVTAKPDDIRGSFERFCPQDKHRPFDEVLAEVTQAFVRRDEWKQWLTIDWIHPSCRDLAIEELASAPSDRRRFLSACSEGGLLLAISVAGGRGERNVPLLLDDADWEAFAESADTTMQESPFFASALYSSFTALEKIDSPTQNTTQAVERLSSLFTQRFLPSLSRALRAKAFDHPISLEVFVRISEKLGVPVDLDLTESWAACERTAVQWEQSNLSPWEDDTALSEVTAFISAVREHLVTSFEFAARSGALERILSAITSRATREADADHTFDEMDDDDASSAGRTLEEMSDDLKTLSDLEGIPHGYAESLRTAASGFDYLVVELNDRVPSEPDESSGRPESDDREIDIDALFIDL